MSEFWQGFLWGIAATFGAAFLLGLLFAILDPLFDYLKRLEYMKASKELRELMEQIRQKEAHDQRKNY
jgi:hypothetical protein